jgi:hypothetical protein
MVAIVTGSPFNLILNKALSGVCECKASLNEIVPALTSLANPKA